MASSAGFAVINGDNKISGGQDVVFFNNKVAFNGAITVPVDNRTGEGDEDEYVLLDLPNIPADKTGVDLYVFVYEAGTRDHNFGMVANARFVLIDEVTKSVIQTYNLSSDVSGTAVHLGRVQRSGSGWQFMPIGEAAAADPNQVAAAYM